LAEVGPDPAILAALADLDAALRDSIGPAAANLDLIDAATALAIRAHDGMVRRSGEPYVVHPIRTAIILASMSLDAETIAGGILHDVVEDTPVSLEDVETALGPRVAKLVDGVTKLGQIPWAGEPDQLKNREKAQQAESLRKMFLAMVDDIGVVLIKLADRLHNMRTLGAMPPEKQVKIALQTMEIYAPLANRLGIWQIKSELEDLAFRYLNPESYALITAALAAREPDRAAYIKRVIGDLRDALLENGVEAELTGRGKHIYSIHRKMSQKGRQFDEIYDVVGVRVIVDSKKDCYGALGVIHSMWHPIPGEFDDYIGTPKESMYQSLHTAVIGLDGHSLEIQIRSREMHQVAEYGVAAHWRYKEGGKKDGRLEEKIAWLRQLMDWQKEIADAEEFVESLKSDVFQDMIYVFTPGGEIKELPKGATPIDFAYRIHTDVGHHCVGAKVNDAQVALDYKLENGQVVKILTSKAKVGPSRDWLQAEGGFALGAGDEHLAVAVQKLAPVDRPVHQRADVEARPADVDPLRLEAVGQRNHGGQTAAAAGSGRRPQRRDRDERRREQLAERDLSCVHEHSPRAPKARSTGAHWSTERRVRERPTRSHLIPGGYASATGVAGSGSVRRC